MIARMLVAAVLLATGAPVVAAAPGTPEPAPVPVPISQPVVEAAQGDLLIRWEPGAAFNVPFWVSNPNTIRVTVGLVAETTAGWPVWVEPSIVIDPGMAAPVTVVVAVPAALDDSGAAQTGVVLGAWVQ